MRDEMAPDRAPDPGARAGAEEMLYRLTRPDPARPLQVVLTVTLPADVPRVAMIEVRQDLLGLTPGAATCELLRALDLRAVACGVDLAELETRGIWRVTAAWPAPWAPPTGPSLHRCLKAALASLPRSIGE